MFDYPNNLFFGAFDGLPIFFRLTFIIIVVFVVGNILYHLGNWQLNNMAEKQTVECIVKDKFSKVRGGRETAAYETYYVSFEFDSKERVILRVNFSDYGQMSVGDKGDLTFQRKRFISFNRY